MVMVMHNTDRPMDWTLAQRAILLLIGRTMDWKRYHLEKKSIWRESVCEKKAVFFRARFYSVNFMSHANVFER